MGTALFRYMSLGSRDPLDDALGGMLGTPTLELSV